MTRICGRRQPLRRPVCTRPVCTHTWPTAHHRNQPLYVPRSLLTTAHHCSPLLTTARECFDCGRDTNASSRWSWRRTRECGCRRRLRLGAQHAAQQAAHIEMRVIGVTEPPAQRNLATLHSHRGLHIEVSLRRVEFNKEPLPAAENDRRVQCSLEVEPANWRGTRDVQPLQHLDAKVEIEMRLNDRRGNDSMSSAGELAGRGCHAETSHHGQRIALACARVPATSRMNAMNTAHEGDPPTTRWR